MKINNILNNIEINIKALFFSIFIFPIKVICTMKNKNLNLNGSIEYEILQLEHKEEELRIEYEKQNELRIKYEKEVEEFKKKVYDEVIKILKKKGVLK